MNAFGPEAQPGFC